MTRESIADRLVSYSDAIVAFALVNSLAFLVALTERDVRCSLVDIQPTLWVTVLAFPVLLTVALVACRRAELQLRAGAPSQEESVVRALRSFHIVRVAIIWFIVLPCVPLIRLALSDTGCSLPG